MLSRCRSLATAATVVSAVHLLDTKSPAQTLGRPQNPDKQATIPRDLTKWAQYGLPGGDSHYLFRENFVICYDSRTRNAKWVLERITAETVAKGADRSELGFYEESAIDPRFRSRLGDYNGSGYDRGHLAPAADHSSEAKRLLETFSLANISPQVGAGFNRDYWARVEKFVRDLTRVASVVYVVTGPLFLPRRKLPKDGPSPSPSSTAKFVMEYELLGQPPNLVAVPNYFFKMILAEQADGRVLVGAFVLPNTSIDPQTPLVSFLVPIDSLERAAGLRFFSQYMTDRRRADLDGKLPMICDMDAHNIAGLLTDGRTPTTTTSKKKGGSTFDGPVSLLEPSHLCEILQCRLPVENFWEGKKQQRQQQQVQQQGSSSSSSSIWG